MNIYVGDGIRDFIFFKAKKGDEFAVEIFRLIESGKLILDGFESKEQERLAKCYVRYRDEYWAKVDGHDESDDMNQVLERKMTYGNFDKGPGF